MGESLFQKTLTLPVSAEAAFAWHERPGAFRRLQPPWEPLEVVATAASLRPGHRVSLVSRLGPLRLPMVFEHGAYEAGCLFTDRQIRGPFASWIHEHRFRNGKNRPVMEDHIRYTVPGGRLGELVAGKAIRRRIERMFAYRHRITLYDLAMPPITPQTLLITGNSGFIGRAVSAYFSTRGHTVKGLSRSPEGPEEIGWDPERGVLRTEDLEGIDAVIHLAGEPIDQRWDAAAMSRIRKSRKLGTRLLAERLAKLKRPPRVLLCASGINYYGDRREEPVDESSDPGSSYLADVCVEWEAACEPARQAGIRVVQMRTGVVLDPRGGALKKLVPIFKSGLGGKVGSGKQRMSWILLEEIPLVMEFLLGKEGVEGPVNLVAPQVVTNAEFSKTLGKALGKPAAVPVPAVAIRMAYGKMGKATILGDLAVSPIRLEENGYAFRYPDLEEGLRFILGKSLHEAG
mgnify:CR=1 FL=1